MRPAVRTFPARARNLGERDGIQAGASMNEHPRERAPAQANEHRRADRGVLTCRELVDSLDAYLEGELPRDRAELFERHLAACSDCGAYLEAYRSAIELGRGALLGARSTEVPDELVDSILAALGR